MGIEKLSNLTTTLIALWAVLVLVGQFMSVWAEIGAALVATAVIFWSIFDFYSKNNRDLSNLIHIFNGLTVFFVAVGLYLLMQGPTFAVSGVKISLLTGIAARWRFDTLPE